MDIFKMSYLQRSSKIHQWNFIIQHSTNEPDILPDSPSGVATKSKLKKITDGAVAFDGDDLFDCSDSADFTMGTDDFTIEMTIIQ